MSPTPNSPTADLQQANADLQRQLAEARAERDESEAQKAAIAEVLGVINSSPGDLAPVFDAMLEKAMRLCAAAFGYLETYDGEHFHPVATRGLPAAYADYLPQRDAPGSSSSYAQILGGAPYVHVADLREGEAYHTSPLRQALVDLGGARSSILVALRREDVLLGSLVIYRREVRPFSKKEIALLQNFAAQAVIAMENARLLTETREALEQQTATAEVLQVINSSPGDPAPVFDAMLEKATRLCEADFGILLTYEEDQYRAAGFHNVPPAYQELLRDPIQPGTKTALARVARGEPVAQIVDIAADEELLSEPMVRGAVELAGFRTVLAVPLRQEGTLLGAFTIYRQQVRPFSEKQIALLQNFAAQAVIAMENARLITETREALEQQTATAEVLGVINNSPGDLAPVFDAMLEKAVRLCDAAFGILWTYDGDHFHAARLRDVTPAFAEFLREPTRPVPGGTFSRMLTGEPVAEAVDIAGSDSYRDGTSRLRRAFFDLGGAQTALFVALRKDRTLLGAFTIYRKEVRPFTGKQTALVASFAAQAVIAMENARLITETREALEQQTATAEVLQVINSSPGELVPVFEAMLDKAIQLCEATFGILRTWDGERFHFGAGRGATRYIEWAREAGPVPPYPSSPLERIKHGERIVHVADIREEEVYRAVPIFRESAE